MTMIRTENVMNLQVYMCVFYLFMSSNILVFCLIFFIEFFMDHSISVFLNYFFYFILEDLIEHMKMISKHVPGWLSFFTLRNEPYIRLSRDADFSRVRGKLENLAQSGA